MNSIENKIDFVALVTVNNANPNGDPSNGNRPRTDYNGYGEISDVCIKRKIRNRMQDMGECVFVQSDERCDDGAGTLKERAKELEKIKDYDKFYRQACEKWTDVRTFGQVFAFKDFISVGIRGPVSIHQAVSMDPVEVYSQQITKSVSGEKKEGKLRGPDTIGWKHFVKFGLYKIKGSINVQLAEKTGFSREDANLVKDCLKTLFVNDSSSARPDGSMEVYKLYWFEHNCKDGQYSSANVHRSVEITSKIDVPASIDDYSIQVNQLPELAVEEINGI